MPQDVMSLIVQKKLLQKRFDKTKLKEIPQKLSAYEFLGMTIDQDTLLRASDILYLEKHYQRETINTSFKIAESLAENGTAANIQLLKIITRVKNTYKKTSLNLYIDISPQEEHAWQNLCRFLKKNKILARKITGLIIGKDTFAPLKGKQVYSAKNLGETIDHCPNVKQISFLDKLNHQESKK